MRSRPARDVATGAPESLQDLVDEYLNGAAIDAASEEAFFGERTLDLAAALARAGRSLQRNGSLHPHQRRIGHKIASWLPAALLLRKSTIAASSDFDRVLREVQRAIGGIRRIGELAIYDVAHRIGCFLNLRPTRVYLHCGTRDGARALGLPWRGATLDPASLPRELRRLTPAQVEDFLCLFKDRLSGVC